MFNGFSIDVFALPNIAYNLQAKKHRSSFSNRTTAALTTPLLGIVGLLLQTMSVHHLTLSVPAPVKFKPPANMKCLPQEI